MQLRDVISVVQKRVRQDTSWDQVRSRARNTFLALLSDMLGPELPTPAQFQGLYLALRWVQHVGNDRKIQYWTQHFRTATVQTCRKLTPKEDTERSGMIGGAKGSIHRDLKGKACRRRLQAMLRGVASSKTEGASDKCLLEFVNTGGVPGLGRSVISSFLWALKPQMYPIVNGGNIESLRKCIRGFPAANSLKDYALFDVPCLRRFKDDLHFKSMSEVDRVLCGIPKSATIAVGSRFVYEEDAPIGPAVEGDETYRAAKGRRRSARLRRQVLDARGYVCAACGMDPEKKYGVKFAHVHHEVYLCHGPHKTDPITELVVLCPTCHCMLHRPPHSSRSWKALRKQLLKGAKQ